MRGSDAALGHGGDQALKRLDDGLALLGAVVCGELAEHVAACHIVAHAAPHAPADAVLRIGKKAQHTYETRLVALLDLAEVCAHELASRHLAYRQAGGFEGLGKRAGPGEVGCGNDDLRGVGTGIHLVFHIGRNLAELLLPPEAFEQLNALDGRSRARHGVRVGDLMLATRVEKAQRERIEEARIGQLGGGAGNRAGRRGRQRHAHRVLVAGAELLDSLAVREGVGTLGGVGGVGASPQALGGQGLEHKLRGTVKRLVVIHHKVTRRQRARRLGQRGQVMHAHTGKLAGMDGAVGGQAGASKIEDLLLILLPEEIGVVRLEGREALAEKTEHALELLGRHARGLEVLLHEVVLKRHDEPGGAMRERLGLGGRQDRKLQVARAGHGHAACRHIAHRLHGRITAGNDAHLLGRHARGKQCLDARPHKGRLARVVRALRHEEAHLGVCLHRLLGGHGLQSHGLLPTVRISVRC